MLSFKKIILMIGVFALQALSAPVVPKRVCGAAGVQVRVPEGMSRSNASLDWTLPPGDFYFKPWFMTYSSLSANLALANMQYDPSIIFGSKEVALNDLASFQLPGESTIYTTYGIDKPVYPDRFDILEYKGTGILASANSTFTWLAWGCDSNGHAYYANFATSSSQTDAEIDILSTDANGPDQDTVEVIRKQLEETGNGEIIELVNKVRKMLHDDGRKGMPRINVCDEKCQTNENLMPILGGGSM